MLAEQPEGEAANENGEQPNYDGANGAQQDVDMLNGVAAHEPGEPGADVGASGAGLRGEREPNKTRVTTPYLTKYERARVLGTRALQIRYAFLPPVRLCACQLIMN